jgi:high-affinity K+ transport system ATPase subunit B
MRQETVARLEDGTVKQASELTKGDVVVVTAGELILGDGTVIEGIASVDESAITGESAPVIRESGGDRSAVTGGTRVLSDRIVVEITQEPGQSFLDRMLVALIPTTIGALLSAIGIAGMDRLVGRMGIRTIMITGDNRVTAAKIAEESGVDDFLAEATPEAKLELIKSSRLPADRREGVAPQKPVDLRPLRLIAPFIGIKLIDLIVHNLLGT